MAKPRFEIYLDVARKYRCRLKDGNGRKVASSGENFDSRANARRAAQNVKVTAPSADFDP